MANTVEIADAQQLGAVVRAVRIASGLTQADAAALCNVSGPFLSGLERGKPTAQIGLILRVCHGLGVRLSAQVPLPISMLSGGSRRQRVRKER